MIDAITVKIIKGNAEQSHTIVFKQQADPEAWLVAEYQGGSQQPFNSFAITTDKMLDMIKRDARSIG